MANPTGSNQTLTKVYDVDVNALRVLLSGSFTAPANTDAIVATYPNDTTEVYTFKSGGTGGTTVMTITVVYTNKSKEFISTVVRT